MPFPRSAYNLKSRLHISHIPTPALVGAGVLLVAALTGVVAGFVSFSGQSPTFEVVASEDAEGSFEVKEGTTGASEESQAAPSSEPSQRSGADQDSAVLPTLAVHVSGAVASPGVYELEDGARVRDAVEAAGGFAAEASQESVNLARKVSDGEQIFVLTVEEFEASPSSSSPSSESSDAGARVLPVRRSCQHQLAVSRRPFPASGRQPLNRLDEREATAVASVEDIQRVSGIGEKKYEKLKGSICV
ncbi:MAG: SLBB domain-containing protein [Slackia sp.]